MSTTQEAEERAESETEHEHQHAHAHEHGHEHTHHQPHQPHDHPADSRADPGLAADSDEAKAASRLPWVLVLTTVFFVVELVAAKYARSEALRADAIHLLADVLAIAIAYAAFKLADRRPTARFTFGLRRIEAVAALLNAVLVLVGAAEIVHEGVGALRSGGEPRTSVMLAVAGAALCVHGINATLLHRDLHGHGHHHHGHQGHGGHHHHGSPHVHVGGSGLSVRGAWLHVVGDALGALCALVAGAAIRLGAPRVVDPAAGFFVALLLLVGGARLVREAMLVLLEAAPPHLPIDAIERAVCQVPGIDCVHRLRVWTLGTGYDAIALHVTAVRAAEPGLATEVEARLRAQFHVDYVCVQVDPPGAHPSLRAVGRR